MNNSEKIEQLKGYIRETLDVLINNDYICLDLPYYTNIGDHLIGQGTENYLRTLPYNCLYTSSKESYIRPKIGPHVIVLLHGGGNFGDLWRDHQLFRNRIIRDFPDNRIIILPQSVHYNDPTLLAQDMSIFGQHADLHICLRDRESIETLRGVAPDLNLKLLPDMAFWADMESWTEYISPTQTERTLFLDRRDHEKHPGECYEVLPANAEARDWPTQERLPLPTHLFHYLRYPCRLLDHLTGLHTDHALLDYAHRRFLHAAYVRTGVRFLSPYEAIYTTRLHAMILGILLDKRKIILFDNSYGKNSRFYNAWLQDLETVCMAGREA